VSDYREQLKQIRTFPSLVRFLRDELDWPVETEDFEELTFDYEPEELGIDASSAAKIDEIKRLRPLAANQPWGIFFVKFEPRQLPVVALRRILAGVVVKKRATASAAEQPKWAEDDLLFISNYGEGAERKISFAHFSRDPTKNDLPTLKVIAWDELDTPRHLDHTANLLVERLSWPSSEIEWDDETWRERWRSAFELRHREVITTSKALAERLAELASRIRAEIVRVLEIETADGKVTRLMKAFREALVHDLDSNRFADMYAQTVAYGLLSARIADPGADTADDLTNHMRTNPFLRELMDAFLHVGGRRGRAGGDGIDFDELGVSEVVELLDDPNTHMEAVVRDFGDRNPQEDPVIHFYEHFLGEYDKDQKVRRGVFYTPRPVVSYIVRSVDTLLRTEFQLEDGLADTTTWGEMAERDKNLKIPEGVSSDDAFVQILDPATGTGTFLVEAVDVVHRTLVSKWHSQGYDNDRIVALWNEYVTEHLLTRLHGYELLMAPYAIAHLKLGLKLYETGYRFESEQRARIYLTNALEPASDIGQMHLEGLLPALAHEAKAVNGVKSHQRFTVVLGNPPYSGVSSNMSPSAQSLVDAYKLVDGQPLNERKHWLQDDYVKFLRLAQMTIERTGSGLVGYITNHAFTDNPTFRGMRQSLLATFPFLDIFDLHGSAKKSDLVPEGVDDQNVFDIQQGVAITVARRPPALTGRRIRHADLWGRRSDKNAILSASDKSQTIGWTELGPESPYYFLIPKDLDLLEEYEQGWSLPDIMSVHSNGVTTARDGFAIAFDDETLVERVTTFLDANRSDADVAEELGLSENYAWRVRDARRELREDRQWRDLLIDILYRPFDIRRIIYHPAVVWRVRSAVMKHMLAGPNLGLCTNRQVNGEFRHAGVTRSVINDCTLSLATKERTYLFPLFLYGAASDVIELGADDSSRANLAPGFLDALRDAVGVSARDQDVLTDEMNAEAVFGYMYAILHSRSYRARYEEVLKMDFPRIPLPTSRTLFAELANRGAELVSMHLLEFGAVPRPAVTYFGPPRPEVAKVGWSSNTVWLDVGTGRKRQAAPSGTAGFRDVPEDVWQFRLGGYQVCEKWLKDRKGRTLSDDDVDHYPKIVFAVAQTIRLMDEIDEVVEEHGGWPDAFAASAKQAVA
jgi:hypothetical protein